MNLEGRFQHEMLRIYEEAKEFDYYPTYFLRMVMDRGGLSAAKQLLSGNKLSDGFVRLWEEQRLNLSVEALALRDPWSVLFTQEELTEAQRRLDGAGYDWRGVLIVPISTSARRCSIVRKVETHRRSL